MLRYRVMWAALFTFLRTWGLVVLLVGGGLAVAWRFVAPPPQDVIRIAVGPEDSAYAEAVEAYARGLAREHFQVERRTTAGAVASLELLRRGEVDIAMAQGGVADAARARGLASLGGVFFEPAWVFTRRGAEVRNALQMEGRRVAVGPEGSGTRVLAFALLTANGARPDRVQASPLTGDAAARALLAGELDAAVFVSGRPGDGIARLMRASDQVGLVNFDVRAAAYATLLPYLSPVRLPRGSFSLPEDLPAEDLTLMAPAAYVATRADLNPQIASLLVQVLQETHRGRQLFAAEGRFPSALNQDLPLHEDAKRIYERGRGFLQSYLPFRWAVVVERLWVLLIPLVTLAIPLSRFAPPIYTWQMESRVYRWYDDLRAIEAQALPLQRPETGLPMLPTLSPKPPDKRTRQALLERLDALEAKVAAISVPSSYGRHLYALRRDIGYVRERLRET